MCLGFEPSTAKWKEQTNPLSYLRLLFVRFLLRFTLEFSANISHFERHHYHRKTNRYSGGFKILKKHASILSETPPSHGNSSGKKLNFFWIVCFKNGLVALGIGHYLHVYVENMPCKLKMITQALPLLVVIQEIPLVSLRSSVANHIKPLRS